MNAAEARTTVPLFMHAIRCLNCLHVVSGPDAVATHTAYVDHMDGHHGLKLRGQERAS